MYIDNGDAGDSGELRIDFDGHEYGEQENYSYARDDLMDSVSVDTGDGGHLVYTDTGHTGTADLVTEFDAHGDPLRQAHFDVETGQWIDTDLGGALPGHSSGPTGAAGESISVDTPAGDVGIGPATVDTDDDGNPDTAVVHDADGDTVLYTDANGDGSADTAMEITADGQVALAEHTGDHEWATVQHGRLDVEGQYHQDAGPGGEFTPPVGETGSDALTGDTTADRYWSAAAYGGSLGTVAGSVGGVVRIDATTGQWISPN